MLCTLCGPPFFLQEAAPYEFEAVDGVVHVWSDSSRRKLLFQPPGTATEFFSDMQWWVAAPTPTPPRVIPSCIARFGSPRLLGLCDVHREGLFVPIAARRMLKVIALGQVRSFTHQRLLLLEQKFNLHVMLNAGE